MEYLTTNLVSRKWLLCSLASFLSFMILFSCINNRPQPATGNMSVPFSSSANLELLLTQPSSVARPPQSNTALPPKSVDEGNENALEVLLTQSPGVAMPPQFNIALPPKPGDDEGNEKGKCDIFDGQWVYDPENYPFCHANQCPFLSNQVSCQKNGRPDSGYTHWRWEPRGCRIPRFNGSDLLERLQEKRMVIVGDSLNRNQWESLACLLYTSVRPSRAVIKVRRSEYKLFRALDYKCSMEFFWSPFLVKLKQTRDGKKVLKLDKLPGSVSRWQGADIMVFNSGHWWTHREKMKVWDYFEHKGKVLNLMEVDAAFQVALQGWAQWIDRWVEPTKTRVFFRSISPEHKLESKHWCYNQTQPITTEAYIEWFPRSMISVVQRTIHEMRTPVKYLNITSLSEYRRDGHTMVYTVRKGKLLTKDQQRPPEEFADCSHWCLPGLPDTWNELIYTTISGSHLMVQ